MIRIVGLVAREWHQRGQCDPSIYSGAWFHWALRALFATVSLLGAIFSDSLDIVRTGLRNAAASIERKWSEGFVIGDELGDGGEGGLMKIGRLICLAPLGMQECRVR